jgi:hypothetical protein
MIYEYKKLGIRIIANSKEEAIENILKAPKYKITSMSFNKEKLEEEIREQTPNIVKWWCLCWYLKNVENKNGLLHHEKVKLKSLLRKLSSRTFKGKNSYRVKKKLLEEYWVDGCEFDKKTDAVISEFMSKFDKEKIEYNENLYQNIAKEFGKEVKKLIDVVCEDNYSKINLYVDNTFQE